MVDVQHLRSFVTVAQELHFGRAAHRLHVSQPSLSRQIQVLERDLGAQLLLRTNRNVTLTPAGAVLMEEALTILASVDQAISRTRRASLGEIGHLRIGFVPSATAGILPSIVRLYREHAPNVGLTLEEMLDDPQIEALRDGRLDVALVRTPLLPEEFRAEALSDEPWCAVVPSQHDLAQAEAVSLGALRDSDIILPPRHLSAGTHDRLISLCHAEGFSPRVIVPEAPTASTILGLVAAGVGVSVLAESFRTFAPSGVVFVPLENIRTTLFVLWDPTRQLPVLERFLTIARSVAAEQRHPEQTSTPEL